MPQQACTAPVHSAAGQCASSEQCQLSKPASQQPPRRARQAASEANQRSQAGRQTGSEANQPVDSRPVAEPCGPPASQQPTTEKPGTSPTPAVDRYSVDDSTALWVPPMPEPKPWNRESTMSRPRAMSCCRGRGGGSLPPSKGGVRQRAPQGRQERTQLQQVRLWTRAHTSDQAISVPT